MTNRSLGHRAPVLWLVLPLVAGLAVGRAGEFGSIAALLAGAIIGGVVALSSSVRAPRLFAPAVCLTMFVAGMASYALHRPRIAAWDQLPPREARVELKIQRTFVQEDRRKAAGLAVVTKAEAPLQELTGQRVYFALTLRPREAAPIRSAVISAIGVIVALP